MRTIIKRNNITYTVMQQCGEHFKNKSSDCAIAHRIH